MISDLSFDEINETVKNKRSVPFDIYFGEMDLPDEEIGERISLAKELEEKFIVIMSLLFTMYQYGMVDWDRVQKRIQDDYTSTLEKYMIVDTAVRMYIWSISYDIVKSTQNHPEDPYYYSPDRAAFMAENEVNTVMNYNSYDKAVKAGKTLKKWIAIKDELTRPTHRAVDGTTKKISEPFYVGESLMMFPKDAFTFGASASEIVNCRCSIIYY